MTTISSTASNTEEENVQSSTSRGNSPQQSQPPTITSDLPEDETITSDLFPNDPSPSTSMPRNKVQDGEDGIFSLKWNEFDKQLAAGFSDLYYTQDFADVTLSCESKSVHAHKIVLAMCSPYFREIFKENPCQHPVVIIKGITFQDLQRILKFIYFGQVSVVKNKIQDFIEAAELIKLDGISSGTTGRKGSAEDCISRENCTIPNRSASPTDCSPSPPGSATSTGCLNYRHFTHPTHGAGQSMRDFPPVSDIPISPGTHGGIVITDRNSGRRLEPISPATVTQNPFPEHRYSSVRGTTSDSGGNHASGPLLLNKNAYGEVNNCIQPTSPMNHGIKKNSSRWNSHVAAANSPRERDMIGSTCPRTSPIDLVSLPSVRPLSNDSVVSIATRAPSSNSSSGDMDTFMEPPVQVKIQSNEDYSPECTRESFGNSCLGEYELSIRSAESPHTPLKSFTTPSGMVVTSTLHNMGHPSTSACCGTGSWSLGPNLKQCTATSASLQVTGKPLPSFRLPLVPAVPHPNGSMVSKTSACMEGFTNQSSVPAKKRFSHVSHRLLGLSEQQVHQETLERHRSQIMKPGVVIPHTQGSPRHVTALTSAGNLGTIPRLKSHRQSHVPPSARYTTAEVDALVDSVTNLTGPYVPCKICDKLVKRERLRAHIHECHLVHGEKIICPHCGVGLKSKGSYRVHVWRHRRGVLAKGIKSKWVLSQRPRVSTP